MITHIVLIKLKTSFQLAEKEAAANQIKTVLDALPAQISEIDYYETGINSIPSDRAYDISIISRFKTMTDLDSYRVHPAHLKVVAIIRQLSENSVVVDYES